MSEYPKSMDEFAAGVQAAVKAVSGYPCSRESEAAIAYVREHFEMVKVRRSMAERTHVYLPGHDYYEPTVWSSATGEDHFLIPKPAPEPEPDPVREALERIADIAGDRRASVEMNAALDKIDEIARAALDA